MGQHTQTSSRTPARVRHRTARGRWLWIAAGLSVLTVIATAPNITRAAAQTAALPLDETPTSSNWRSWWSPANASQISFVPSVSMTTVDTTAERLTVTPSAGLAAGNYQLELTGSATQTVTPYLTSHPLNWATTSHPENASATENGKFAAASVPTGAFNGVRLIPFRMLVGNPQFELRLTSAANFTLTRIRILPATTSTLTYEADQPPAVHNLTPESSEGGSGGWSLGYWSTVGQFVRFTVTVPGAVTGASTLRFRVASPAPGSTRTLSIDGVTHSTIVVPTTGAWNAWADKDVSVSLAAGTHTVELRMNAADVGGINIDYLTMLSTVNTTTTTSTSTASTTTSSTTSTTTTSTTVAPNGTTHSLYGPSVVPSTLLAIGPQYSAHTAVRVNISCAGRLTGVSWYRGPSDIGTITVAAWRVNGATASGAAAVQGSASFAAGATAGWAFVPFSGSGLAVVAGDRVLVDVHHPNGAWAHVESGLTGRSITSVGEGCLTAPAHTTADPTSRYEYTTVATLSSPPSLGYPVEYFVSPILSTTPTPTYNITNVTTAPTNPPQGGAFTVTGLVTASVPLSNYTLCARAIPTSGTTLQNCVPVTTATAPNQASYTVTLPVPLSAPVGVYGVDLALYIGAPSAPGTSPVRVGVVPGAPGCCTIQRRPAPPTDCYESFRTGAGRWVPTDNGLVVFDSDMSRQQGSGSVRLNSKAYPPSSTPTSMGTPIGTYIAAMRLVSLSDCSPAPTSISFYVRTTSHVRIVAELRTPGQTRFKRTYSESDFDAFNSNDPGLEWTLVTVPLAGLPTTGDVEVALRADGTLGATVYIDDEVLSIAPRSAPTTASGLPPTPAGWTEAWADDFSGSSLHERWTKVDTKKFTDDATADNPNRNRDNDKLRDVYGIECYDPSPQNVEVSGGTLKLRAIRQETANECHAGNAETAAGFVRPFNFPTVWKSGMVAAVGDTWARQRGRFEARLKMDTSKGSFPAFWMMPQASTSWPRTGEIDIVEFLFGGQPVLPGQVRNTWEASHTAFRATSTNARRKDATSSIVAPTSASGSCTTPPTSPAGGWGALCEWHVYALEWDAAELRWYVDGDLVKRMQIRNGNYPDAPNAPFDQKYHIRLNQAVGGPVGGLDLPNDTYVLEVDYVAVYQ